jgi:hypothetical protein
MFNKGMKTKMVVPKTEIPDNDKVYKITPCYVEDRGNLKMLGVNYPIEFKEVKNVLVVHIKEDLGSDIVFSISQQLKRVFGDQVILFAFKDDVSFFIAQPMAYEELEEWMGNAAEKAMELISKGVM